MFSKNLVLLYNIVSWTQNLVLVNANVAPVVHVAGTRLSPPTASVLDISEIKQSFYHDKSSSISELMKDKSRYLQKLLKFFRTTTFVTNVLA